MWPHRRGHNLQDGVGSLEVIVSQGASSPPTAPYKLGHGDHRRSWPLRRLRSYAFGEHGHPYTLRGDLAVRRLPCLPSSDGVLRGGQRWGFGEPGGILDSLLYRSLWRAGVVAALWALRRRAGPPSRPS